MAAISARNLSFKYAGAEKPSMENVSVSIEKGEFVILTGPSGCGKTTLCRCLNGLIPNFYSGDLTGNLEVDGVNVTGKTTRGTGITRWFCFPKPRESTLFVIG